MFRKCLKYDLKSVSTIWFIMAATVLGLSVVAGNCARIIAQRAPYGETDGLEVLGIIAFIFTLVAFITVTAILVYLRFYKNFYTDEGYLTFTLPVKRTTLFASKVANAFIWQIATFIVIVGALAIMVVQIPAKGMYNYAGFPEQYRHMLDYFATLIHDAVKVIHTEVGAWIFLYIAEIVVFFFLTMLSGIYLYYLCITVAAVIAKKNKGLVAIALVYGSGIVVNSIYRASGFLLGIWAEAGSILYVIEEAQGYAIIGAAGALACVVCALVCLIFRAINLGCLERKLNLA